MRRPHVTFFGGKGGVGKTTCAASAASLAAAEGALVLVVSTDPAHSLGDALQTTLGPAPKRVRRGLFAVQLDADRALARWLRQREDAFKTIAERGTYLDDDDVDRLFSLSLPGVDELVGLVELTRLARTSDYDHVVVDTAPTGHTLRLLSMPETLRRFAEVLDDMHAKHRFLASSLGGRWRPDAADAVIAGVEQEALDLGALLADHERCSFTWVTLPETLPIDESEDGVRAIEALGVAVPRIVVNRVWPAPDRPCPLCTPRAREEAACLARIARTFRDKTLLTLPAVAREPRGPGELLLLARAVRPLGTVEAAAEGAARDTSRPRGGAASPGPSLLGLPESARLALVGGKGGVGKTSVACALALAIAQRSPAKKVLLLSTDPAHSIGDALDAELADEPRRVPGGPKNLVAREIDARGAFEAEKARYRASIDDLFASIFRGAMDASYDRAVLEDLLELAPPGLDELFSLLGIIDALFLANGHDVVVVDTAPTGHTLRLLELPASALEWVHAIMAIILKYRRVIGLGELATDLTSLAKRLRALIALLEDPARCAFVAVSRPAALPRLETERLVAKTRRLRVPLASIVVNAVTAPSCARCARAAAAEEPEIASLAALARRSKAAFVLAPAIHPPPRGAAALRAWSDAWFRPSPARGMLRREAR